MPSIHPNTGGVAPSAAMRRLIWVRAAASHRERPSGRLEKRTRGAGAGPPLPPSLPEPALAGGEFSTEPEEKFQGAYCNFCGLSLPKVLDLPVPPGRRHVPRDLVMTAGCRARAASSRRCGRGSSQPSRVAATEGDLGSHTYCAKNQ
jgi:hypothetical protein